MEQDFCASLDELDLFLDNFFTGNGSIEAPESERLDGVRSPVPVGVGQPSLCDGRNVAIPAPTFNHPVHDLQGPEGGSFYQATHAGHSGSSFADSPESCLPSPPLLPSDLTGSLESNPSPESYLSQSPLSLQSDFPFPVVAVGHYDVGADFFGPDATPNSPGTKCRVCLDAAGKHSAYGGKVCASCRAFFRRSVQTKYYEIFTCARNQRCDITSATRKSCKYCRFKKCLEANMQISWVLTDQERDRRFNKLKKVSYRNDLTTPTHYPASASPARSPVRPLPSPTALDRRQSSSTLMNLFRAPANLFSTEEFHLLDSIRTFLSDKIREKFDHFFTCEPDVLQHIAHVAYFGGSLKFDLWKRFTNAGEEFAQGVFLNMDDMQELTLNDRHELIKANGLVSYTFIEANSIGEESSGLCASIKNAVFSGHFPSVANLVDILSRLGVADKIPVLTYEQTYVSPWTINEADERRHRDLLSRIKSYLRGFKTSSGTDFNLINLTRFVIAFSTDNVRLEKQGVCEKVRDRYHTMLYRYLRHLFGDEAQKKFSEAMEIQACAREATEILRRRNF